MKNLHPKAYWLFALRGIVSMLVSVFAFGLIIFLNTLDETTRTDEIAGPLFGIGLALVVVGIPINLGWSYLAFKAYKYELTEDGFRKEHGVIAKKYTTIPYERIQNVDINRGPIARILGLSELQIQTAGASGYNPRRPYTMYAEGVLPGVSISDAEQLREELIRRSKGSSTSQGL